MHVRCDKRTRHNRALIQRRVSTPLLRADHETYAQLGREANLENIAELVALIDVIPRSYGRTGLSRFKIPPSSVPPTRLRLVPPEVYLQHIVDFDDDTICDQVVSLNGRLLRAVHELRDSKYHDGARWIDPDMITLAQQTSTPRLHLEVLLTLLPLNVTCTGRNLDEALLAVAVRLWCKGDADALESVRNMLEMTPTSLGYAPTQVDSSRVSWPWSRCPLRFLQFLAEAERIKTSEMIVASVATSRLPVELTEMVLTFLLEAKNLPGPGDIASVWIPRPSAAVCGRDSPRLCNERWDAKTHRFTDCNCHLYRFRRMQLASKSNCSWPARSNPPRTS